MLEDTDGWVVDETVSNSTPTVSGTTSDTDGWVVDEEPTEPIALTEPIAPTEPIALTEPTEPSVFSNAVDKTADFMFEPKAPKSPDYIAAYANEEDRLSVNVDAPIATPIPDLVKTTDYENNNYSRYNLEEYVNARLDRGNSVKDIVESVGEEGNNYDTNMARSIAVERTSKGRDKVNDRLNIGRGLERGKNMLTQATINIYKNLQEGGTAGKMTKEILAWKDPTIEAEDLKPNELPQWVFDIASSATSLEGVKKAWDNRDDTIEEISKSFSDGELPKSAQSVLDKAKGTRKAQLDEQERVYGGISNLEIAAEFSPEIATMFVNPASVVKTFSTEAVMEYGLSRGDGFTVEQSVGRALAIGTVAGTVTKMMNPKVPTVKVDGFSQEVADMLPLFNITKAEARGLLKGVELKDQAAVLASKIGVKGQGYIDSSISLMTAEEKYAANAAQSSRRQEVADALGVEDFDSFKSSVKADYKQMLETIDGAGTAGTYNIDNLTPKLNSLLPYIRSYKGKGAVEGIIDQINANPTASIRDIVDLRQTINYELKKATGTSKDILLEIKASVNAHLKTKALDPDLMKLVDESTELYHSMKSQEELIDIFNQASDVSSAGNKFGESSAIDWTKFDKLLKDVNLNEGGKALVKEVKAVSKKYGETDVLTKRRLTPRGEGEETNTLSSNLLGHAKVKLVREFYGIVGRLSTWADSGKRLQFQKAIRESMAKGKTYKEFTDGLIVNKNTPAEAKQHIAKLKEKNGELEGPVTPREHKDLLDRARELQLRVDKAEIPVTKAQRTVDTLEDKIADVNTAIETATPDNIGELFSKQNNLQAHLKTANQSLDTANRTHLNATNNLNRVTDRYGISLKPSDEFNPAIKPVEPTEGLAGLTKTERKQLKQEAEASAARLEEGFKAQQRRELEAVQTREADRRAKAEAERVARVARAEVREQERLAAREAERVRAEAEMLQARTREQATRDREASRAAAARREQEASTDTAAAAREARGDVGEGKYTKANVPSDFEATVKSIAGQRVDITYSDTAYTRDYVGIREPRGNGNRAVLTVLTKDGIPIVDALPAGTAEQKAKALNTLQRKLTARAKPATNKRSTIKDSLADYGHEVTVVKSGNNYKITGGAKTIVGKAETKGQLDDLIQKYKDQTRPAVELNSRNYAAGVVRDKAADTPKMVDNINKIFKLDGSGFEARSNVNNRGASIRIINGNREIGTFYIRGNGDITANTTSSLTRHNMGSKMYKAVWDGIENMGYTYRASAGLSADNEIRMTANMLSYVNAIGRDAPHIVANPIQKGYPASGGSAGLPMTKANADEMADSFGVWMDSQITTPAGRESTSQRAKIIGARTRDLIKRYRRAGTLSAQMGILALIINENDIINKGE